MKRIINLILNSIIAFSIINAQAQDVPQVPPQAINYTGFAYDAKQKEISNKDISVRASVFDGDDLVKYEETHYVTTDYKGLFSIKVGEGNANTQKGLFSAIPWANSSMKLSIEIDPNGGSNYVSMGIVTLLSVPYALYAGSTGDSDDEDPDPTNELQFLEYNPSTNELSISDGNVVELGQSDDPTDEIQDLELQGTTLRITNNPSATSINLENIVVHGGQYYFGDMDTDLFGNPFNPAWVPTDVDPPPYFVEQSTDCNDDNASINPDAEEIYDQIDNNCDGEIDENICIDNDGDGYGDGPACLGTDCYDWDANVYPGAIVPNGDIDESCVIICNPGYSNCDGNLANGCETVENSNSCGSNCEACEEGYDCVGGECVPQDLDGDGFTADIDCDDSDPTINPAAPEICDGKDNNCNGRVDQLDVPNSVLCADVPHANSVCAGVQGCIIDDCDNGFIDCNGDYSDGCEVNIRNDLGVMTNGTNIGTLCGDDGNNVLPTISGIGQGWFRVFLEECSSLPDDLTLTVQLDVPSGINYDLKLYSATGELLGSSTKSTGLDETVNITINDEWGSDESGNLFIQITSSWGESCNNWSLDVRSYD